MSDTSQQPELAVKSVGRAYHEVSESTGKNEPGSTDSAQACNTLIFLQQELNSKLSSNAGLEWDDLVALQPFKPTQKRKPFIKYDQHGGPVDITYLSMPNALPEEPKLPPKPVFENFEPDVGGLEAIAWRKHRQQQDAKEAFRSALSQWEALRQKTMEKFVLQTNQWMEAAKAVDYENEQRYQQCIEDQQIWWKQKQQYDKAVREARALVENFRQVYLQKQAAAVQNYVIEVLSRSVYPDCFPADVTVSYEADSEAVAVTMRLLHPNDFQVLQLQQALPSLTPSNSDLPSAASRDQEELYSYLVRAICVCTLHDVLSSDMADAVQHVVVNAYVDIEESLADVGQEHVIASVEMTKQQRNAMRQMPADAIAYFEQSGGRGTRQSIAELKMVEPFLLRKLAHVDSANA